MSNSLANDPTNHVIKGNPRFLQKPPFQLAFQQIHLLINLKKKNPAGYVSVIFFACFSLDSSKVPPKNRMDSDMFWSKCPPQKMEWIQISFGAKVSLQKWNGFRYALLASCQAWARTQPTMRLKGAPRFLQKPPFRPAAKAPTKNGMDLVDRSKSNPKNGMDSDMFWSKSTPKKWNGFRYVLNFGWLLLESESLWIGKNTNSGDLLVNYREPISIKIH
ncbi:hypothetical protein CEXT_699561 [Caerostris extrusa]|uniref:Uncharacterized protein n=1 Tax=Caerostris extrusa TaxID=172846 RepID=A0AAV4TSP9_CAEEX|nr:hypothetical protein CEXT_699561 [Caerostris extrusa]